MYATPTGYRDAVTSANRSVDVFLSIGTGIDNTSADDLTTVIGAFLPMSNTSQITDAVYQMTEELATFEGNGIKTSLSAGMVVPPLSAVHYPPESGIWSSGISDGSGAISFQIVLNLSAVHSSALRLYTAGPNVIEATATFDDGTETVTKSFTCSEGYITVSDVVSYSKITVNITKIDRPYSHVRLVECEFGASVTLSRSELGGEVVCIDELDPLELTSPMRELDLSVINVSGIFDPDNPLTRLGELRIGYPINLSYTVNGSGRRYTVPCGRFVIGERDSSDTRVDITAFDVRYTLTGIYVAWTLPSGQSLGKTLDDLLTEYDIPHLVDTDLYSLMPDTAHTFDDQSSIADDLLTIQQAYAVYFLPSRSGSIRVTTEWPSDTYGTVPTGTLYSWPSPKQTFRYNFVTIGYQVTEGGLTTTYYVQTDLRTDPSEMKTVLQISGNPLITTQARATAVMTRLISRIYSEEVETDCRGDPAMDLGDDISIPGRWTQDAPRSYTVTYKEETFDGTYRVIIRGTG